MSTVALLLALDDESDPARELPGRVAQGLDGLDPMQQLTLVVADAARVQAKLREIRQLIATQPKPP